MPFVPSTEAQPKVIGKASTLKLVNKSDHIEPLSSNDPHAIPKNSHWADETDMGTVLVIEQPSSQTCAAVGGIMAARMKMRGLLGCVVGGRVRDLMELRRSGLPVSARLVNGTSPFWWSIRCASSSLSIHMRAYTSICGDNFRSSFPCQPPCILLYFLSSSGRVLEHPLPR